MAAGRSRPVARRADAFMLRAASLGDWCCPTSCPDRRSSDAFDTGRPKACGSTGPMSCVWQTGSAGQEASPTAAITGSSSLRATDQKGASAATTRARRSTGARPHPDRHGPVACPWFTCTPAGAGLHQPHPLLRSSRGFGALSRAGSPKGAKGGYADKLVEGAEGQPCAFHRRRPAKSARLRYALLPGQPCAFHRRRPAPRRARRCQPMGHTAQPPALWPSLWLG